jgi:hypothetical protein
MYDNSEDRKSPRHERLGSVKLDSARWTQALQRIHNDDTYKPAVSWAATRFFLTLPTLNN